ncbi:beta-lactamase family protein [Aquiflexum sp. TKW24L]|uniref:serine hydrolase domain-containing protein n=1 Tax=Aquiflexum sp. TKW24L TaxID=2942212 RepID=UPI0020BF2EB9|nr:serine hydrolase domain-containing protein [Aquiflexum sp. TKW24L]MCL6259322.1 beta-lactamase family protein [Aquiflexum sp. TKW24L]
MAQTTSLKKSPPLSEATPQSVGISPERLKKLDAMLEESIKNEELPGLVALIVRNGKIVYHSAKGFADVESGKAMQKDAIFRIASQTKAITSTAVMMLWEEGKFRLDDPISKFIPEFKNPQVLQNFRYGDTSYTTVAANKEITICHLLTHSAGIGYGGIDQDERIRMIYQKEGIVEAFDTKGMTNEINIKKLAKLPLIQNPGEKFRYSMSIDVLGYLVEVVSGMPLDKFFQERIFSPLGMKDTWFYLPENLAPRLVEVHVPHEGKWIKPDPNMGWDSSFPISGSKSLFSGGGGLSSTAMDYAKFLQMYLNGGEYNGVRILSRNTIETMMANQSVELDENVGTYHGLAFAVTSEKTIAKGGLGSLGTFEWGGAFNTQYFADPKENIIGIILKQTLGGNEPTGWKFKQMVYSLIDD